ncbi:unnamed protein product, partial [Soboliphyme baturini]|uniref:C2H2-type domain-containing protein n=1 Tax=Soboliphyme baturini TaxID=241478 RepID=A0A183IXH4_9BILA
CSFCLRNQPHPRLARGENYSCGYKPYRCNVCKYSTTTKGNLSIHMQSDKHLSNVHELQQAIASDGTGIGPSVAFLKPSAVIATSTSAMSPEEAGSSSTEDGVSSSALNRKCKSSFRCDVCNYETNIARNLRIHMTSEKHAQNLLLIQPHLNLLHAGSAAAYATGLVADALESASMPSTDTSGHLSTAYPPALNSLCLESQFREGDILRTYILLQDEQLWSSGSLSSKLFQCCICIRFMCESIDQLSSHIYADRSKSSDEDVSVVNHVREGGESNEWRLNFLNQNNPVQLRCVACNELCTNLHKLQSHVTSLRHGCSVRAWRTVDTAMTEAGQDGQGAPALLLCTLCRFYAASRSQMFAHLHSAAHVTAASRYVAMIEELAPGCCSDPLPDWVQVRRAPSDALEEDDCEIDEDDEVEAETERLEPGDIAASADSHGWVP